MANFIAHPWDPNRVGDFLTAGLQDEKWTEFRAAVAFARKSGTQYIAPLLSKFAARPGSNLSISIGVDFGGSTYEGVKLLVDALAGNGKLWVYRNLSSTFHPKIYLFRNDTSADVVVGSGNLTKGGLFENSEAFVRHVLDFAVSEDKALFDSIESALNRWAVFQPKLCLPLDSAVLAELHDSGDLPKEAVARAATKKAIGAIKATAKKASPFKSVATPKAPPAPAGPVAPPSSPAPPPITATTPAAAAMPAGKGHIFGMTLQNTDVGVGQTTKGKQKRSPEVFIPLLALDQLPTFWNWKTSLSPGSSYKADTVWRAKHAKWFAAQNVSKAKRPLDKLDWKNVQIRLAGHAGMLAATVWFNPEKKDIRIRQEHLRSAGSIGDILLVRRAPAGSGYDYDMQVVKTADPAYATTFAKLGTKVPGSPKHIGYF